jgi:hypothetical protein
MNDQYQKALSTECLVEYKRCTCNQSSLDVAAGSLKVFAAVLVAAKCNVKVGQPRADQRKECSKANQYAITNSLQHAQRDGVYQSFAHHNTFYKLAN